MDRGLINRVVELQTRLSRLEGKTYIQFQVVRNNTVPLELLHEVMYYNYEANEFIYFNPLTRKSEKISIGSGSGMTFTDLVAILQAGTNVTLDVDTVAETITINSSDWIQIQSDWNQTDNTQVDYIKNKPTEFPPSAHTHSDTEVNLTETYTGNLSGATTQKDANDILDALVGGGGGVFIRRSFFTPPFTSYRGFAPESSLETDAVWTVTKTVENENGTIFSNEQVFNHKWTEINTI